MLDGYFNAGHVQLLFGIYPWVFGIVPVISEVPFF
jgi:hypothetical protein